MKSQEIATSTNRRFLTPISASPWNSFVSKPNPGGQVGSLRYLFHLGIFYLGIKQDMALFRTHSAALKRLLKIKTDLRSYFQLTLWRHNNFVDLCAHITFAQYACGLQVRPVMHARKLCLFVIGIVVAITSANLMASQVHAHSKRPSESWLLTVERSSKPQKIRFAGIELAITPRPVDNDRHVAQIEIRISGSVKGKVVSEVGNEDDIQIRFEDLDSSNLFPELIVTHYSGGAHCCFITRVVHEENGVWKPVKDDLGADGDEVQIKDIDGDGTLEVAEPDGVFLYSFASYADSLRPVRLFHLKRGRWVDVSRDKAFQRFHAISDRDAEAQCVPEKSSNGFWAGYVATQALAGRRDHAWKIMLKCYDQTSDWGLCVESDSTDNCVNKKGAFPEVLKSFLSENGYW